LGPFQLVWMQPVTTSQELIWQTHLIGQHGLWLDGACPRSLVEHICLSTAGPSMFDWSMLTVLTIVLSCDMIVIWWCYPRQSKHWRKRCGWELTPTNGEISQEHSVSKFARIRIVGGRETEHQYLPFLFQINN
jgi:hypothetical protein